jgi:hypothetical protein
VKEGAGIHDAHPHTHIINFSPNSCRKTSTDLALAPGSPQSAKRSNVKFNIRDFCLLFLISLRFGKHPHSQQPPQTSPQCICCCQIHPDADVHITCATAAYSVQNVSRWWNGKVFWKEIIQRDFCAGENHIRQVSNILVLK